MTIETHDVGVRLQIPGGYVDVPAHDVDHGEETTYAQGFESYTVPDWVAASNVVATVSNDNPHGGSHSLHVEASSALSVVGISRVISGLTVGLDYTLTAWVNVQSAGTPSIWSVGDAHQDGDPDATGWQEITLHFTAGSTVRQFVLEFSFAGTVQGDIGDWDDITLVQDAYAEHIPDHIAYTADLKSSDVSVTLDEGWAPYAQATLTVAMPAQAVYDAMDPDASPRPRLTLEGTAARLAGGSWGDLDGRTFDLALTSRVLDHNATTIAIQAASDEAILQGYALVSTETNDSALADQASLRDVINNHVLSTIDAELEAGDADADVTTLTSVTNLILNPGAEVDASNWAAGGGCTIARSTAQHFQGSSCLAATATTTSGATFANSTATYPTATPNQQYAASIYVRSSAAGATATVTIRFLNAASAQTNTTSASVTLSTTAWTRLNISAIAPADAAHWAVYVSFAGTASGRVIYMDGAMMTEGDGLDTEGSLLPYFDGDTSDTALYNYTWTDTANASTSERTPVFDRPPDSLTWQPGESGYDFIAPVCQAAGLRLFCDEQRKWYLVDNTYSVDGQVKIRLGDNLYEATDTRDVTSQDSNGVPYWFDACVIKYTWNDSENVQQTRYDAAGSDTPIVCALIEYQKPYPGPGAAAYIISRVQGRGRVLTLTARMDWTVTPGMAALAVLPLTPFQTGYVSKVTWDLSADTMDVGTRGLIDTPANAWILQDPGSWADAPTGPWVA